MSHSVERLVSLFESKGYVPNNYFTVDDKYRLVEIVSFNSAVSIIIDINDKYQIPAQNYKHEYVLTSKPVNGELIQGLSNEAELRSSYQEIDHISRALESEDKLHDLYDKPISLRGEETRSKDKFSSTVRQMKRFRLCVRNIPFKLCLFDDDCICLANDKSDIECFYINNYKMKKRKLFITTTLEYFFNTKEIELDVGKITDQFYDILNENQKHETNKIQTMIDAKRNIASQSKKILDAKKKLTDKIKSLQTTHMNLTDQQKDLNKKIREIKNVVSKGIISDTAKNAQENKLSQDSDAIEEKRKETIKSIIDTRRELDEMCLVVDNVLFDNMLMLTKISENFKILERIKV